MQFYMLRFYGLGKGLLGVGIVHAEDQVRAMAIAEEKQIQPGPGIFAVRVNEMDQTIRAKITDALLEKMLAPYRDRFLNRKDAEALNTELGAALGIRPPKAVLH